VTAATTSQAQATTAPQRWAPPARRPLVLYELNEVPWRVVDWYTAKRPGCELSRVLERSATFTTHTRDEGELHPWCTWPTLHRGVYNTTHNIRFINQDKRCAEDYPPVWETAARAGRNVGVFGSLQSYPVPASPAYAFYVPDTFAPGPEAHPPRYSPFQRFNLRQTRADGAISQDLSLGGGVMRDLAAFPRMGVTARTLAALAGQVVRERIAPMNRVRRSLLQPVLAFDVFMDAVRRYRPEFCTFFTNHVASVMHRYWKYTFPEDFNFRIETPQDVFNAQNVRIGMDIADRQIGVLRRYVEARDGQLAIASSMGQEAIDRGEYAGELRISNARALADLVGFDKPFRHLLAMQPDFNFEFESEGDRIEFVDRVSRLVDEAGQTIWYNVSVAGRTLNLALASSGDVVRNNALYLARGDGTLDRVALDRAGMKVIVRDEGTGYHQPKGILIWFASRMHAHGTREQIELAHVRSLLLEALEVRG